MFDDLVNLYDDFTKNERTQSLSRLAYENDFPFVKREPFGEQTTILRDFKIFQKKGVKRLLGIIHIPMREGMEGEIRFYDFLVTKDLETKTTSVVEIYVPDLNGAQCLIKPRTAIAKTFNLSSSTNTFKYFNKLFKTIPTYEFSEEIMLLLLDFPKVHVECQQDLCIFYRKNKQIKISEIFKIVTLAENFVSLLQNDANEDFV